MCKLVLDGGNVSSFTSVSNVFIDEYMNKANGEFVKIYLHLLRMVSKMNDAPEEFSTEKIADHFGILESDVYRALSYWNDEEDLFSTRLTGSLQKEHRLHVPSGWIAGAGSCNFCTFCIRSFQ